MANPFSRKPDAKPAAAVPVPTWQSTVQEFWEWTQGQLGDMPVTTTPVPTTPVTTPVPVPTPVPTGSAPVSAPASGYTFADEFDGAAGSAPDPSKWVYDLGAGGWGNGELETYSNSTNNAYVDGNSNLVIAATTDGKGNYWSARLKTLGKFAQLGGSFEARIKLNSQPGIWPAFWMMGQDITSVSWPKCGEVDILEDFGKGQVQSTVHTPDGSSTYQKNASIASDTAWHVYRLDWDLAAETFTFYRDGVSYLAVTSSSFPVSSWVFGPGSPNNGGMFFLLNVAVGGYVGAPKPASWPVEMMVDYVHAWK